MSIYVNDVFVVALFSGFSFGTSFRVPTSGMRRYLESLFFLIRRFQLVIPTSKILGCCVPSFANFKRVLVDVLYPHPVFDPLKTAMGFLVSHV